MTFLWPQYLWLLLALPVLPAAYLWLLRRRGRAALRYSDMATVRAALAIWCVASPISMGSFASATPHHTRGTWTTT